MADEQKRRRMRQEQAVRDGYDAVAETYAQRFGRELDDKAADRAHLRRLAGLADGGLIADVGCGPGGITSHLAELPADVVGFDLSPAMVEVARRTHPGVNFLVGSVLDLPFNDGVLAAAVAFYSVIHLRPDERVMAFTEIARALRPGGHLLVAVHTDGPGFAPGSVNAATEFLGHQVQMDGYFIDADILTKELTLAGFTLVARADRSHLPEVEYPSHRTYQLAQTTRPE